MSAHRFLGTSIELRLNDTSVACDRFGQQVDLPDADLVNLIGHSNAPFITEEAFAAAGFTEEELQQHFSVTTHDGATDTFKNKKRAALLALHNYRESLKSGSGSPQAA